MAAWFSRGWVRRSVCQGAGRAVAQRVYQPMWPFGECTAVCHASASKSCGLSVEKLPKYRKILRAQKEQSPLFLGHLYAGVPAAAPPPSGQRLNTSASNCPSANAASFGPGDWISCRLVASDDRLHTEAPTPELRTAGDWSICPPVRAATLRGWLVDIIG